MSHTAAPRTDDRRGQCRWSTCFDGSGTFARPVNEDAMGVAEEDAAFSRDLASKVTELPPGWGPQDLRRRLRGHVVIDETGGLRFSTSVLRDAAYRGLPFRERRALHLRAADAIAAATAHLPVPPPVLSLHLQQAGEHERCHRAALAAADEARGSYAMAEATELYQRALAAAKHLEIDATELARVWSALGDASAVSGSYSRAAKAYATARRLSPGRPADVAVACIKEGNLAERRGRRAGAVRWLRRGLRTLEGETGAEAARARALLQVAYAVRCQYEGRLDEAERWCRLAIAESEETDDEGVKAQALLVLDTSLHALGRGEEAVHAEQALAIWKEAGDRFNQGWALNSMGAHAYWEGRWHDALDLYRRSVDIHARIGNDIDAGLASCNIAEILIDQGRLDAAERMLLRTRRTWRACGFAHGIPLATRHLGRVALRRGDPTLAEHHFLEARATLQSNGMVTKVAEVDLWRAECRLVEGDVAAALGLLDASDVAIRASRSTELAPMLLRLRACALTHVGDAVTARACLDESLAVARARGADYDVALALTAIAALGSSETEAELPDPMLQAREIFLRLDVEVVPTLPLRPTRAAP